MNVKYKTIFNLYYSLIYSFNPFKNYVFMLLSCIPLDVILRVCGSSSQVWMNMAIQLRLYSFRTYGLIPIFLCLKGILYLQISEKRNIVVKQLMGGSGCGDGSARMQDNGSNQNIGGLNFYLQSLVNAKIMKFLSLLQNQLSYIVTI